jgi:dipeptidyl aminopeptidase/acylaminoacyl peptidase
MRIRIAAVAFGGMLCLSLFAHAVQASRAPAAAKRPIAIEDEIEYAAPFSLSLSPDARHVAYVLQTRDIASNTVSRDLFVVSADGKSAPRLVRKDTSSAAVWADDSKHLLLAVPMEKGAEIRTLRLIDGVEEVLYANETAISSLGLSPDGRSLAFLTLSPLAEKEPEKLLHAIEADEDWNSNRQEPRVFQLAVMDLATRRVRTLTDTSITVGKFDWSPDSRRLAIEAHTEPSRVMPVMTSDIHIVDVADGTMRPLVAMEGMDVSPKWSPDGKWIAFASQRGQEDFIYATTLAIVPADGSSPPRYIGDALDRSSGDWTSPLRWSADGRYVDVNAGHDLSVHVFRVRVSDGYTSRITPRRDRLYSSHTYSREGKRVALVEEGVGVPREIYIANADDMKTRRITRLNPQWENYSKPIVERVRWRSHDDKWDLNGILLKPSHYREGQRYPMLLALLGGPAMVAQAFNPIGNYPLLTFAEAGYVVFIPNTRGRAGYGMDFAHAIRDEKSYIGNPLRDALGGVDLLVAQGVADPDRMGVLGYSYGGALTSNLITRDHRFKAAIYGGSMPDLMGRSMDYMEKQLLGLGRDMFGLGNPFEPEAMQLAFEQSSVFHAHRARTPLLLESGEFDGWEDDRRLYRALKHFGVPSEFYVYPRSGHGWEEPALIADSYRRNLDWLNYWVLDKPYRDPQKQAVYDAWKQERRAAH